jgi:hypothetical protein
MYIFCSILKPVSIQKLDDDFIVTIELCAVAADPVHASFLLFVVTLSIRGTYLLYSCLLSVGLVELMGVEPECSGDLVLLIVRRSWSLC